MVIGFPYTKNCFFSVLWEAEIFLHIYRVFLYRDTIQKCENAKKCDKHGTLTLFWLARWKRSMFFSGALVLNDSVMTLVRLILSGTAYLRTQPPWWCSEIFICNTSEIHFCRVLINLHSFHALCWPKWRETHLGAKFHTSTSHKVHVWDRA